MQGILPKYFGPDVVCTPGNSLVSLQKFHGTTSLFDIDLENVEFVIHPSTLFGLSQKPLVFLTIGKLSLRLNNLPEIKNKAAQSDSFERWLLQRLIIILSTILLKRIAVEISDFSVKYQGNSISFASLSCCYKRTKSEITIEFVLSNLCAGLLNPLVQIAQIKFSVRSTLHSLKYILSNLTYFFYVKNNQIEISYNNGKFTFEISPLQIGVKKDPLVQCEVNIEPIHVYMSTFSINTESLSVTISDVYVERNFISVSSIIANSYEQAYLDIPGLNFSNNILKLPSIVVDLSLPFLMDICMLLQLIPKKTVNPNNLKTLSVPFIVATEKIDVTVHFSDIHIVNFEAEKFKFHDNHANGKKVYLKLLLPQKVFPLAEIHKLDIDMINERTFKFSVKHVEMTFSPMFAYMNYLIEIGKAASYLASIFKGPDYIPDKNEAPTPFQLIFESNSITMSMLKKDIADSISRSMEAKRISLEGLQIRQQKAIEMIESSRKRRFNEDAFYQTSNELLFNIFRRVLKLIPPQDDFITAKFTQFSIDLNGFAIPNREAALNRLTNLSHRVKPEEIGQIDAFDFRLTFVELEIQVSRYGKCLGINQTSMSGSVFIVSPLVNRISDAFHLKFVYNEKDYMIPIIATNSEVVVDFSFTSPKLSCILRPSAMEILQDYDLILNFFLLKNKFYKSTSSIDLYRIDIITSGTFHIDHVTVRVTDYLRNYRKKLPLKIGIDSLNLEIVSERKMHETESPWVNLNMSSIGISCLDISKETTTYKRFIKLPQIQILLSLISFNRYMEDNEPPFFVPVDSSRVNDTKYDPFKNYRSHMFSFDSTINMKIDKKAKVHIDFDIAYSVVMEIFKNKSVVNGFISPPNFLKVPKIHPIFTGLNVTALLPAITISMFNGLFNMDFTFDEILFRTSKSKEFVASLSTKKIDIVFASTGFMGLIQCDIEIEGSHTSVHFDRIESDLSAECIRYFFKLSEFIPDPEPDKISKHDPLLPKDELFSLFINELLDVKIDHFMMGVIMPMFAPNLEFNDFWFSSRKSDDNLLTMSNINCHDLKVKFLNNKSDSTQAAEFPLFNLKDVLFNYIIGEDRMYMNLTLTTAVSMNLEPQVIYSYVPLILKEFPEPVAMLQKQTEQQPKGNRTLRTEFHIPDSFLIKLVANDTYIASISGADFNYERVSHSDGSETDSLTWGNIQIQDSVIEKENSFGLVAKKTVNDKSFLSFKLRKHRNMMKCIAFDNIKLRISPMEIHLSKRFIDFLIEYFPSASDFNIFDTDQSEDDSDQSSIEQQTSEFMIDDPNSPVAFFGDIRIKKIALMMNVRFSDAKYTEFLDREFIFDEYHIFDTFGSKDQMITFLKHVIIKSLIKALPRMIIAKKKDNK